MNPTIVAMTDFVKSGSVDAIELGSAIAEIGRMPFRLVAINTLSWLKSQRRMGKLWPLALNEAHEWCRNFRHLIEKHLLLVDLICIKGESIVFLPELDDMEVQKILDFVDANYQPRLMK